MLDDYVSAAVAFKGVNTHGWQMMWRLCAWPLRQVAPRVPGQQELRLPPGWEDCPPFGRPIELPNGQPFRVIPSKARTRPVSKLQLRYTPGVLGHALRVLVMCSVVFMPSPMQVPLAEWYRPALRNPRNIYTLRAAIQMLETMDYQSESEREPFRERIKVGARR